MTKQKKKSIFHKDAIAYTRYYGYEAVNGIPIDSWDAEANSKEAVKFIDTVRIKKDKSDVSLPV